MSTNQDFIKKVAAIQSTLKAHKSQRNNFGNYNYRNQEDILEAVKPLLGELVLTVSDDVVPVGDRIYVKSTATITDGIHALQNVAFAREPESQKGMGDSQITGSTSSYARKYALNGLLLIDDTKDADSMDNTKKEAKELGEKASPVSRRDKTKVEVKEAQQDKQPETVNNEPEQEQQPEVNTRPVGGSFRRRGRS